MKGLNIIMERKPRKPIQKRAIEKYERIVDAAFKLFDEKGYYNTTTADIAKAANVATGSVYSYFEDKKDIYIQVIEKVNDKFTYPTNTFWEKNKNVDFKNTEAVKNLFRAFLKLMIKYHDFSKNFHDDMEALQILDSDIAAVIKGHDNNRMKTVKNIFNILSIPFKSNNDSDIFLHYCNLLVDDVCHKILYDKTVQNIDLYIERVVEMLYTLFLSTTEITK